jgi:hypothetical protein
VRRPRSRLSGAFVVGCGHCGGGAGGAWRRLARRLAPADDPASSGAAGGHRPELAGSSPSSAQRGTRSATRTWPACPRLRHAWWLLGRRRPVSQGGAGIRGGRRRGAPRSRPPRRRAGRIRAWRRRSSSTLGTDEEKVDLLRTVMATGCGNLRGAARRRCTPGQPTGRPVGGGVLDPSAPSCRNAS